MSSGKNLEIQYLRFFSVVMIMFAHLNQLGSWSDGTPFFLKIHYWFPLGSGVDIFFVISGYFMGVLLLDRVPKFNSDFQDTKKFALSFWKKRFLRLFPAAFFWSVFALFVEGMIYRDSFKSIFLGWLSAIFQFKNIEIIFKKDFSLLLNHYWSLSVENQFYFLLPICLLFFKRKYFWIIVLIILTIETLWIPGGDFCIYTRSAGLLYGVIAYQIFLLASYGKKLWKYIPSSSLWRLTSLIFVTFCLLLSLLPIGFINTSYLQPFCYSYAGLIGAIIVLLAACNRGFIYIPRFLKPLIYWGGELSYSFYLCHPTIYHMIHNYKFFTFLQGWSLIVFAVLLSIGASVFSYFYIECPFYKTKPLST